MSKQPYEGSWHATGPAMDFNAMPSDIMKAPRPVSRDTATPNGVPDVKVSMVPGPEGVLTELLLRKGSLKYIVGETVWFDNAEQEVMVYEEDKRLILRRID